MAPKTGNNYICGTLTDSVEISTPNSGCSMMSSSIKDWSNDCDNDRLPEIARLAPKTSISGCRSLTQSPGGQFLRAGRRRKPLICRLNCHPVCHSSRYISISGLGHTTISGCRSLSQSLGDTLFGLIAMIENPGLSVGISTLSVV